MGFCNVTNQEGTYYNRCLECLGVFIGYKNQRYCSPCVVKNLKALERITQWSNEK